MNLISFFASVFMRRFTHFISHRVPQGSILGRTLFDVYINNLLGVSDYCKLYLSFSVKDIDRATPQITKERKKVASWRCQNSLLINPDKMKLLLIGTCQMLQNVLADLDLHVTLLGKELHPVLAAKDPGVHGCYIKF